MFSFLIRKFCCFLLHLLVLSLSLLNTNWIYNVLLLFFASFLLLILLIQPKKEHKQNRFMNICTHCKLKGAQSNKGNKRKSRKFRKNKSKNLKKKFS